MVIINKKYPCVLHNAYYTISCNMCTPQIAGLLNMCGEVMHHVQTYHMQWPDQLSQVKEKAQHNNVSPGK